MRMGGNLLDPERFGTADQGPEQTPPARRLDIVQVGPFLRAQPHGDELRQARALLIEDAQRTIAGLDQVHGSRDDPLQHHWQLQLPTDCHDRVQQRLQPVPGPGQPLELR